MITFTTLRAQSNFSLLPKVLRDIALEMDDFLEQEAGKDLYITETISTLEQDLHLKRVSASHRERRAIDVRNYDWSTQLREAFVKKFSQYDETHGAISPNDGVRRFLVDKTHGTGSHYHIQIGADLIEKFKKEGLA
jgi:hypothetical protein